MTVGPGRASRSPDVQDLADALRGGDRAVLARAITLIESTHPERQARGQAVLTALLPYTGGAHRLGITGVPGVGKSTFIEALGKHLTADGHRVAVLAVDPSSQVSGGSILGDKTRMQELARDPGAFIRPSPSGGTLGGVAGHTREASLLCEAAGYDLIIVETVGTGQSETVVAQMVDTFLLLLLAGAGDELQGIKRGVLELADVLAVNKADGDGLLRAQQAAAQHRAALTFLRPRTPGWKPRVLTASALQREGIGAVWRAAQEHRAALESTGAWEGQREAQRVSWMWSLVQDRLRADLRQHPAVRGMLSSLEAEVQGGRVAPGLAAQRILEAFRRGTPQEGDTP